MSQPPYDDDRPVRNGLLALVGVSVAVGLILAVVALLATHVLGLAGGSTTDQAGAGETMYVPPPAKMTDESDGPMITLDTPTGGGGGGRATSGARPSHGSSAKSKNPKRGQISLQALETTVPSFGKIDLTGVYPGGEGEILQVQRRQGGAWADFPLTVPVSNSSFSTYVQTGVSGRNSFRVLDKARGIASNVVEVTVK